MDLKSFLAEPTQKSGGGLAAFLDGGKPADEWESTEYGFKVKPAVTSDTGKPTVQRDDGAVWYGPEQGNTGKPGWFTAQGERAKDAPGSESLWDQLKGSVKYGVKKSVIGARQMRAESEAQRMPMVPEGSEIGAKFQNLAQEELKASTQAATQAKKEFQQETGGGLIPTIVSEAADPVNYIPVAGPLAKIKAVSKLGKLAVSAVKGGLSAIPAAALRPVAEGGTRDMTGEVVGGAVGGPLFEKVVGPGLAKTINTIRGRAAKGAIAPAAKRFVEDLNLLGISEDVYTAGQALGKGGVKAAEGTLREVPFVGDKAKLQRGLEELTRKVQNIDGNLQAQMKKAGYQTEEALENAYAAGDRNARRIMEDVIPKAEDDAYKIIKASTDAEKARRAKVVNEEFRIVDDLTEGSGNVDTSGTNSVINQHLAENAEYGGNPLAIKELEEIQRLLMNPADYRNTRRFADRIGAKANKLGEKFDDPDFTRAAYVLRDVRDALRGDMKFHVETEAPQAIGALDNAMNSYKKLMVPYKGDNLQKVLDAVNPDETIGRIIDKKGVQHAMEQIYPHAGEKGKAAIKYAWFHDKLEKAMTGDQFSPGRLATALEDDLGKAGVIFQGKDLWEMQALANVLRRMDNTPLGTAVINNGLKAAKYLAIGGAAGAGMAGGAPAVGALFGIGMFAKFLTQGPGKKYLIASSKFPPGSEQYEKILEKAFSQMPRMYGVSAANELGIEETP